MYELLGNFYRMWSELRHWHDSDFRTFAITYRYERGAPGFSKAVYESGMMGRGYFYWDIYLFMEDQNETLAASLPDCKLRRAEPLTVQLAEYEASVLATNQNVLIALHNVHSGNDRRCHL
ncbi:hypothetical protein CRM86_20585 [Pseudomonas putida]|nr:hypothetical protein CRM86_20585 [Pseudomonas putida]